MASFQLTEERHLEDVGKALEAIRPRRLTRTFVGSFGLFAVTQGAIISWGVGDASWLVNPTSPRFWIVVVGASCLAVVNVGIRLWSVRGLLRHTPGEVWEAVGRDWMWLTRPGWPGRLLASGLGASVATGLPVGILLAALHPDERIAGSIVLTILVMIALLIPAIVPLVFGMRYLWVAMLRRYAGNSA